MANESLMKFPVTVTLAAPLKVGEKTIKEIVVREPKGRDWKRWASKPDGQERTMGLLCDLTGLDEAVFDEMSFDDHARCVGIAEVFFARYQPEESGLLRLLMTSPSSMAGVLEMLKTST